MYSVTNRRCLRRHECPCKCSRAWGPSSPYCHLKGDCQVWRSLVRSGLPPIDWWLPIRTITRMFQAVPVGIWLPIRMLTRLIWGVPIGWCLPIRTFTRLVWAVPISWLPTSTLTCLVCAPFLPGRRWGWSSPGPEWILPSSGVPLLVSLFRNLLFLGFLNLVLSDLQLRGWPCTVVFEGHLTNGHKNRKMPGQICGT